MARPTKLAELENGLPLQVPTYEFAPGGLGPIRIHSVVSIPPAAREYHFHAERKWRFDYAWPEFMVALEVEGGIWRRGGGAHSRPANIVRDIEKYNEAALAGWLVLRALPEQVRRGDATKLVARAIALRGST